jgi:hypothetical protein
MDNDEPGAPPYSLEDVPYVMYFRGAYAFHSAFWHEGRAGFTGELAWGVCDGGESRDLGVCAR